MWDPARYLAFADHRGRPFFDLVGRVDVSHPRRVVDVGCGPGNLTVTLAHRWPEARIEALDSSPEMVVEARARGLDARLADLVSWFPEPDTDVVISNAVLQWVPGHQDLMRRWAGALGPGSWLAVQVPGNFGAPSHALIRDLAVSSEWSRALSDVVRPDNVVSGPRDYADLLTDAGCEVDAWETSYLHALRGDDPVLEWITGTALRPIRAALDDESWQRFRTELAARLRTAYPARADGVTWFEFRRVFVVARTT